MARDVQMSSINTNVAAMTALQTLTPDQQGPDRDAEPHLHGLPRRRRLRQCRLLVDRDHHALRQRGPFHRAGRPGPRRRHRRCRLHGASTAPSRWSTRSRASWSPRASPASTAPRSRAEITELQIAARGIADSATFSGENWLSVDQRDPGYNATKSIVSSFSRSGGVVAIGIITIDLAEHQAVRRRPTSRASSTRKARRPTAA